MIAATSLQAYRTLDPAQVASVKARVLLTIARARMPSNADIERLAGIRLSSVCARVNELKAEGLVEPGGIKTDPFTRRSVQWWRATEAGRRALEGIA
jgi:DNA-binding MarR family transcriptional regulator